MAARHNHDPDACRDIREILGRVGDKWTILVVGELHSGPVRFNELKRRIEGVSQRMLTRTLRNLERDGLVQRTVLPTNPPQVDYALTELGREMLQPLSVLGTWVMRREPDIRAARRSFDLGQEINGAKR